LSQNHWFHFYNDKQERENVQERQNGTVVNSQKKKKCDFKDYEHVSLKANYKNMSLYFVKQYPMSKVRNAELWE
jgi:hypothetical protein